MTPDGSMIPDEIAEILHERAGKLWTQWWEERKENPTFLQVIMDTPLNPGTRVVVESLSQKYMDCQPGDENYLQWSAALIDETVTPTTCEKLNIVLDTISGFQGTSAHESMAYLTFLYVAHIDMQRAAEREASILFTDRCEQYDDFYRHKENIEGESRPPEQAGPASWRLDQVLDFWYAFGGKFARGFPVPEPKAVGRWCYFQIPPVWLPVHVLEKINEQLARIGRKVEPVKIPALVGAARKNLWESLDDTWQEFTKQGIPVPFDVGNATGGDLSASQDQPQHTPHKQVDFSHVLTHSDDFLAVRLRGEDFILTHKQSRAVKFLLEEHERNIPEVHQQRVLLEAESTSKRLRDLFNKNPGAWKNLIRQGKGKGCVRLNIFDD